MSSLPRPSFAPPPLFAAPNGAHPANCIPEAGQRLLPHLERGSASTPPPFRARWSPPSAAPTVKAMGLETAYDACEAATMLFLRNFGPAMRARAASPAALLPMWSRSRASPRAYAPLPGEPGSSAILDADRARTRRQRRRGDHAGRCSAGAFGGNRIARHLRRIFWRIAGAQRTGRDPSRTALDPLSSASASPASTPRRSTIISMPASRRASC